MIQRKYVYYFITSVLFAALMAGASEARGDTYYFSTSGNDNSGNNDCTNYNDPCRTIQRAEQVATPNSKLLFREGDTWDMSTDPGRRLTVNKSGVIVNAYNASNGIEIVGESLDKPTFTGNGAYPSGNGSSLVIIDAINVNFANFEIKESHMGRQYTDTDWVETEEGSYGTDGGHGLIVSRVADGTTVQYCVFHDNWLGGIYVSGPINNVLIDRNEAYNNSLWYRNMNAASPYPKSGWAGNISLAGCSNVGAITNCIASNNYVHESFGEGISLGNSTVAENNIVSDTSNKGIYINAKSNSVIRSNYVVGTDDTTFLKQNMGWHGGMGVSVEASLSYLRAEENRIYNNIVINCRGGLEIKCHKDTVNPRNIDGLLIYGNTWIDNDWNIRVNGASEIGQTADVIVKNNISYCNYVGSNNGTGQTGDGCTHWQNTDGVMGITIDHNLWYGDDDQSGLWSYSSNLSSQYKGSNDRAGDPKLVRTVWKSIITDIGDVSADEAKAQNGGDGINYGTYLGDPYNVDYFATTRPQGVGWDIGAHEYTSGPANLAPIVNAGTDQTITLPTDTVSLNGTVTDDGLPDPPATITTVWSMLSGAGTVIFADENAVDTTASFSAVGTYVLRLTADDSALHTSDDISITVNGDTTPPAEPTDLNIVE